ELSGTTPTANLLTGLGTDEIFSRLDSGATIGPSSFLTDALHHTIALTNSNGGIPTQYTYQPFGNTTLVGTGNPNSFQYTGRENDNDSLYFYRARYYSSTYERSPATDLFAFSLHIALPVCAAPGPMVTT